MPPEPSPWDRSKERRYGRSSPDAVGPSSRWWEPPPQNGFRGRMPVTLGNGRPVPWRYHSAESDRGFSPSRGNVKFIGDEGFRSSGYRVESRYNKFNRENSDPFVHRDIRGHTWENGMSPNNFSRPHFGSDRRSIDDRGSYRQKDIKGHFWENGRMLNGGDQRSLNDKGSFGRRDLRGKSWEKEPLEKKNMYLVDDKEPFEKKGLKRHSPENCVLINSTGKPPSLYQMSLDDKRSSGEKDLSGKICENGLLPNRSSKIDTVSNQSSMDDKDIKGQSVENGVVPKVSSRNQSDSDQRPIDDMLTFTSPTHSNVARTQDEHSKYHYEKSSGANNVVTDNKLEKENSLGSIAWKPLKWTRSGSLSSRGSEPKTEVSPRIDSPPRSPTGDAAVCVTVSAVSSEEAGSRKKPRLGWGEGLAKFEKKKVEGPDDDSATKPGLFVCLSGEPFNVSNLAGQSPRVPGLLECASQATLSSDTCSSPPGFEDKVCIRSENLDYGSSYSSGSPNLPLQGNTEGIQGRESRLENMELTSVANLSSSLNELFQLEEPAVMESSIDRSTAIQKLLEWRGETLKALEVAEFEIDSLENELKTLNSESVSNCPKPATSSSLNIDHHLKPCENVPSSSISQPAMPLVIYSPGVEKTDQSLGKDYSQIPNSELDTRSPKFDNRPSEVHGAAPPDPVNNAKNCEDMDVIVVEILEGCAVDGIISNREDASCHQILASNKETATRSYEIINKLLLSNDCSIQASRTKRISSRKDDLRIMKKFAFKKRCSRFNERVNALKYRALQHLWKKDLQLMSSRKDRPKSKKRLEINLRRPRGSNQKYRFLHPLFSNAGKLSLVPTPEAIKITRKLLSDSQAMPLRDSLKMPALIMDAKEKITSTFISSNGLVEDPCAMEKERAMLNPWIKEEKEIFMDKLATLGKDFNKISSFLAHKTTADCVEFYYKIHKSDDFVKLKMKKQPEFSMQRKSYSFNNYLVGSGKRYNWETNAASLDVLGEASAIAAIADNATKTHQETSYSKAPQIDRPVERSHELDVSVNERETEAANVLAGICGSISSSAMIPCMTSSFDRGESYKELTNQREGSDSDLCSDDSCGDENPTDWTEQEKSIFLEAVTLYGNDFAMLSRRVGTKSKDQCRVFFSKSKKCFGLDKIRPRPCDEGNGNNGGDSDNECACVVEIDAVVSSEKAPLKGEKDVLRSDVDMNGSGENKNPDQSEKMVVDSLTVAVETNTGVEGNVELQNGVDNEPYIGVDGDLEMQNGVDNEPTLVSEPMSTNEPYIGVGGDLEMQNGVDNEPTWVSEPMSTDLHHDIVEDRGSGEALSPAGSPSADVANDHGSSGSCGEDGTVDPGEPQAEEPEMASENSSNSIEDENCSNNKKETRSENNLTDLNCVNQELPVSVNVSNVVAGSFDAPVDFGANIERTQKIALDLNPPIEEPLVYDKENSAPEGIPSSTHIDFDVISQKLHKKSTSVGTTSSSVFVGYPLQMAGKNEMKGNYSSVEGFLRRCSGSDTPISSVESPKISHSRHHSWSSSDSGKPKRNGDVKLFGQILKSQPERNIESTPENTNLEIVTYNNVESNSVLGEVDCNNYLALENFPSWSVGFWNRNKTQMGYPSLSDSAILLAKYPAAFGNFSSTSNLEQQLVLQSRNGDSVFPSREMAGGNEAVDYQLYENQQDLILEMQRMACGNVVDSQLYKNQQDLILEMQKRNRISAFSSLRNPIGVVGTNIAISDPVAAIKMHYANMEQVRQG